MERKLVQFDVARLSYDGIRVRAKRVNPAVVRKSQGKGRDVLLAVNEDLAKIGRNLGWDEFVGGGIEVHRLRGNHVTYIRRHVGDTAQALRACLEGAVLESS